MSFPPGTRLGVYEVAGLLGEGGMGAVYRALDTRLNRDVALKVLLPDVADDPQRLARFRREAQLLASLNHPNIGQIHGLEEGQVGQAGQAGQVEQVGTIALVLEYIEGPTLADRMAQGPLALNEALAIARQIVEALEAAHDRGIVHRDLKPANIKVRRDGTVKVLDFGLAKAAEWSGRAGGPGQAGSVAGSPVPTGVTSPTLTSPALMTGVGVILGTAAYMSPEQARGFDVDRRADMWAFGVILFEMLTGRRLFDGPTVSDTLALVLTQAAPIQELAGSTPEPIVRLLRRCLEREPGNRLDSAAAARLEIVEALANPNPARAGAPATRRPIAAALLAVLGVAVGASATFVLSRVRAGNAGGAAAPYRLQFVLPPDVRVTDQTTQRAVISPDGRMVAFIASKAGSQPQAWVRRLDTLDERALPGTDRASVVFWSPDSQSLGFIARGAVRKVSVTGGPPVTICEAPTAGSGAAWGNDGIILFGAASGAPPTPLRRVSADGGTPEPATTLDTARGENSHTYPSFLPDGRHFLYRALSSSSAELGIFIGSLDSADRHLLLAEGGNAQYARGHLLYVRGRTLMAQPLDTAKGPLTGTAVPIADGIALGGSSGRSAAFSVSDTGVLAYHTDVGTAVTNSLTWFDRTGRPLGTIGGSAEYKNPRLSPDGSRVAVEMVDASRNRDIWVLDVARPAPIRLTSDPANDIAPLWSPDGRQIAFSRSAQGAQVILRRSSNGDGGEAVVAKTDVPGTITDATADRIVYYSSAQGLGRMWSVPWDGAAKPSPLMETGTDVRQPRVSPDGRWLAYVSNESGEYEVYVQQYPVAAGKWRVSTTGGIQPVWRRDGKEIFFLATDGQLMAASFSGGSGTATIGQPVALFETQLEGGGVLTGGTVHQFDVSTDGSRFLMPSLPTPASSDPITLLINWPSLLAADPQP